MNTFTFGLGHGASGAFNGFNGQGGMDIFKGTPAGYRVALAAAGWGSYITDSVPDDIAAGEYPLHNGLRIQVR